LILFTTIYMVILTILSMKVLLQYLFNKFRDGHLILKLFVIISNFIVLGYMYTGVQTGVTIFQIKYEILDNKDLIMQQLTDVTYKTAIAGTIAYIIGQLLMKFIKHIEDKEYKKNSLNPESKAWDNFYNK